MFEDTLCLPFGRIGEIDPDVHSPRPTQHGIDTLDVIGCGEKKSANVTREKLDRGEEHQENKDGLGFGSGSPIQAAQKTTQTQCGAFICLGYSLGRHSLCTT